MDIIKVLYIPKYIHYIIDIFYGFHSPQPEQVDAMEEAAKNADNECRAYKAHKDDKDAM